MYLIVGAGVTGKALARYLRGKGEEFILADDRIPDYPKPSEVELNGVELVVLSPGVPMDHPIFKKAKEAGVEVVGDVEFAYRRLSGSPTIVAVTGTNGKSTTTTLIGDILKRAGYKVFVGGNLGTPFVEALDGRYDVIVLELSSFQLDKVKEFKANIACLLNISYDHGDYYRSFSEYVSSKLRVFNRQGKNDWAVVMCPGYEKGLGGKVILLGRDILVSGTRASVSVGKGLSISLDDMLIPGVHNLLNASCAAAVGLIVGVEGEVIVEALKSFRGLPHRLEFVGERNGVRFYNDSKGTNLDAVRVALESFSGDVILLLGGKFKGGSLSSIEEEVRKKVKLLCAFGEAGPLFYKYFREVVESRLFDSLKDAVEAAVSSAEPGDTVLLSPGCSSFDEFKDYKDRGDFFKKRVLDWIRKN